MNWKIHETVNQIKHQISLGNRFPEGSRLDLTSVPNSEQQEWQFAIEQVFKKFNIPCPPINFVSDDEQSLMRKKINDIFAGIANEIKEGKKIQINLDFEGNEQFVTSLPPMLLNHMRAEYNYVFINSENIYDENGKQVAILMKFDPFDLNENKQEEAKKW